MNGHRQRGMAIISALLIVTVVAVIAAGLIARQSAFIRALESEQLRIQAGWMLRGGLEWSRQLLLEDSRRDPLTRLDQRWAQPMRGLRLSSAELPFNGQLEDEQGKFNLRNLLVDQRPDLQERANFERLAGLLGVRPKETRLIVERVLDSYARLPAEAPPAETQPAGALGAGLPEDRRTAYPCFALGYFQQPRQARGILAQQTRRVGAGAQADGRRGDADDYQHHHQFDQGETALPGSPHRMPLREERGFQSARRR